MPKNALSLPDEFAQSPLLAILPAVGDPARLVELTSSLYARYESVTSLLRGVESEEGRAHERLSAEEAMLKKVLDWLNLTPGDER